MLLDLKNQCFGNVSGKGESRRVVTTKQLAGFQHSAFTFGYESMVHRNGVQEKDIPPAGLISFVQKGIQYLELETNLNEVSSSVCQAISVILLNHIA